MSALTTEAQGCKAKIFFNMAPENNSVPLYSRPARYPRKILEGSNLGTLSVHVAPMETVISRDSFVSPLDCSTNDASTMLPTHHERIIRNPRLLYNTERTAPFAPAQSRPDSKPI
jgi:hypothetical protein